MGVRVTIGGNDYQVEDYSVQEQATPLAAGDSSGSVGTFDFSLPLPDPDVRVPYTPNAFGNPGYQDTSGTETLETNLFPNPSFESTDGTVEVRRNWIKNPMYSETSNGWSTPTSASHTALPGVGRLVTATSESGTPSGNQIFQTTTAHRVTVQEGDVVTSIFTVEAPVTNPRPVRIRPRITEYRSGGLPTVWGTGPNYDIAPGETLQIVYEREMVNGAENIVLSWLGDSSQLFTLGDELIVHDGWTVKINDPVVEQIGVGLPSPDPDLTPEWTGTPHNSESILTAPKVAHVPGGYQSQQWAASGDSSWFLPELEDVAPGFAGYQQGTGTQAVDIGGTLVDRTLYAVGDVIDWDSHYRTWAHLGVSTVGAVQVRTRGTGTNQLGGRFDTVNGSSDAPIWYGTGSRSPGRHITWAGTTDGMTVRQGNGDSPTALTNGLTPGDGMEASPPLSVTSTTSSDAPIAAVAYRGAHTEEQRAEVLGWLHARYMHANLDDQTFLITPRNDGQIVHFDGQEIVTQAGKPVRIYGSGYVGLSPGWWDNQAIIEGEYDGPYFDGDSGEADQGFRYEWSGTPHDSPSVLVADIPSLVNPLPTAYRITRGGTRFLKVEGSAQVIVAAGAKVFITALNTGQTASYGSATTTSTRANEVLELSGGVGSVLTLSTGIWSEPIVHMPGTTVMREHPINRFGPEWLIGQTVEILSDSNYGFTLGAVDSVSPNPTTVQIQCQSRLGELNIHNVQSQPFVGTLRQAFHYYAELAGVFTDVAVDDLIADRPVALPGFSGELWYHLKQLAAAQDCDISLVSGVILLRPIRSRIAERGRTIQRSGTTGGGSLAQAVEVYWYRTGEITDELVYPPEGWNPEVEVLNVNAGETAEYTLELSASLSSFQEPEMRTWVGQHDSSESVYTVVADDGLPVAPAYWRERGGQVEITLNPDTISLNVKLVGAVDVETTSGQQSKSFSLALASDDSGSRYSTLRIVGTGVSYVREMKRIRTGVSAERTSTEIGVTIDNPFINDLESLYRAGVRAAKNFTGGVSTTSAEVTTVTQRGDTGESVSMSYGAVQDTLESELGAGFTYGQVQSHYASEGFNSYGDVREWWASQTIHDFSNQTFGNVQGARIWDPSRKRWFRVRSATTTPSGIRIETADDDLLHEDVEEFFKSINPSITYGEVQLLRNDLTYEQERTTGLRV